MISIPKSTGKRGKYIKFDRRDKQKGQKACALKPNIFNRKKPRTSNVCGYICIFPFTCYQLLIHMLCHSWPTFFMLLLSAFIWFGLVFNEVNFAQPSSSSYKICLKWADLVIFLWRGKGLHPNTQLYLEPDVPGPPLHSAALKGLPVPPLKTCVRHKAHQFLGIITSD